MYEKVKTLVVEDTFQMRKVIVGFLEGLGFCDIQEAADGQEAWKKIAEGIKQDSPFVFIVCDWKMPKMDGQELLGQIRESEQTAGLPFLMVTGLGDQEHVMRIVKTGVSDFIVKPFTQEVFREKVAKILRRHHLEG